MPETNENIENEFQYVIDEANEAIELAEQLEILEKHPLFIKIFHNKFIEDFAITNTMNFVNYSKEKRGQIIEKQLGRSVFASFCYNINEQGIAANEAKLLATEQMRISASQDVGDDSEEHN